MKRQFIAAMMITMWVCLVTASDNAFGCGPKDCASSLRLSFNPKNPDNSADEQSFKASRDGRIVEIIANLEIPTGNSNFKGTDKFIFNAGKGMELVAVSFLDESLQNVQPPPGIRVRYGAIASNSEVLRDHENRWVINGFKGGTHRMKISLLISDNGHFMHNKKIDIQSFLNAEILNTPVSGPDTKGRLVEVISENWFGNADSSQQPNNNSERTQLVGKRAEYLAASQTNCVNPLISFSVHNKPYTYRDPSECKVSIR